MSNLTKDDVIRNVIEYLEQEQPQKFIAGETYIPTSGMTKEISDYVSLIGCALDGWFTEGKQASIFKKNIRQYLGNNVRFVTLCNSGSSANLLAITAICQPEFGSRQAKPGDEIITTAVGFPTTLSPIVQNGLIPVFVDVNFPTYTPDIDLIEEAISDKTKAIFLTNPLGNPIDYTKIRDLCDEYGLWFIVDNCDSFGSMYDGKYCGTMEDIATHSYFPAHHISTGEGGAVLTNSPLVKKVVDSLSSWGRACSCLPGQDNKCGIRHNQKECAGLPAHYDHKSTFERIGYNMKMTDLQASLGVSQLTRLSAFVNERERNWNILYDGLKKWEQFVILPKATKNSKPAWFGFVLTLQKNTPFKRYQIIEYLETHKVGTRMFFGGNLLSQPAFQNIEHRVSGKLYNSSSITKDTFWVGVHPNITEEMAHYMVETFNSFFMEYVK